MRNCTALLYPLGLYSPTGLKCQVLLLKSGGRCGFIIDLMLTVKTLLMNHIFTDVLARALALSDLAMCMA
jgi:hypothetical protein